MDRYEISEIDLRYEVNLGKSEYICFNLFEARFLIFSSKEETMRNIHIRNVVN